MNTLKLKRLVVALIVAASTSSYGAHEAFAEIIAPPFDPPVFRYAHTEVTLTPGLVQETRRRFFTHYTDNIADDDLYDIYVEQRVTINGITDYRPISYNKFDPYTNKKVRSESTTYFNAGIPLPPAYPSAAFRAFWLPSVKTWSTYTYTPSPQNVLTTARTTTLRWEITGSLTEMSDLNKSYDPTGMVVILSVSKRVLCDPMSIITYDSNWLPILSGPVKSTITTTTSTPIGGIKSTSVQVQNALGVVTSHHLQQHTVNGDIIRDTNFNLAAKQFVDRQYTYNVPGVNARLTKYVMSVSSATSLTSIGSFKAITTVDYRFDGKALRYEKVTYNASGPANKLRYTLNRNTAGVVMSITVNEYTDYVNPANSFLNVVFRDIAVVSDEINGVPAINSPTLNTRMGLPQASQASAMPALTGDLVMMDQMLTLGQDEADCPNCQAPVGKEDLLKQAQ